MKRESMAVRVLLLTALGFVLLGFAGCGYRPTAHAVKPVVGESICTQIVISMQDPDNTVLLKDALDEAVVNRFRSSLTDEAHAQTCLVIELKQTDFIPVRYDTNGYIIAYRAIIRLQIDRRSGGKSKSYRTSGSYLFTIEPNAIISDLVRYDAIRNGAEKALDSFVARIASEGALR